MRTPIWSARRKDFRVRTFKSGGPGGQHKNKTESAVEITHIESGLGATSQSERSQHTNKKNAFNRLVPLLLAKYIYEAEERPRFAAGHKTTRSYHRPNNRVTDHLTGKTFSFKRTVGKGDIAPLIDDRVQQLEGAVVIARESL